jgi:hypothetical protein
MAETERRADIQISFPLVISDGLVQMHLFGATISTGISFRAGHESKAEEINSEYEDLVFHPEAKLTNFGLSSIIMLGS